MASGDWQLVRARIRPVSASGAYGLSVGRNAAGPDNIGTETCSGANGNVCIRSARRCYCNQESP